MYPAILSSRPSGLDLAYPPFATARLKFTQSRRPPHHYPPASPAGLSLRTLPYSAGRCGAAAS
jgi:hypothetical protein